MALGIAQHQMSLLSLSSFCCFNVGWQAGQRLGGGDCSYLQEIAL